jgi:glycosyltransferase involved in cell wall biosynthesis
VRVAQIAPMYEAVPPSHYGGTERVVWSLGEELVARGHEVTLFASGDSTTTARLVPTVPQALRRRMGPQEMIEVAPYLHLRMLSDVYRDAAYFDVIHSHVDHFTFPFARLVSTPTLNTMHGRLDPPALQTILAHYPDVPLVSISLSQRRAGSHLRLRWIGNVYNGIRLDHFRFEEKPGSYLLFIGRISPEKRPDWAVEVAVRSGLPLVVGAKVDPMDQQYWKDEIEPLFRRSRVEFLGEVEEGQKADLMAGAYATLFPIDWPEPFGLVMVESLASGTPVVAMRRGSVPEVLRDGRGGFLCDTVDDMVRAVEKVVGLDRAVCREEGERFSSARMADGYERLYRRLVRKSLFDPVGVKAG